MKFKVMAARLRVASQMANRGKIVDVREDELPLVKHLIRRSLIIPIEEEIKIEAPDNSEILEKIEKSKEVEEPVVVEDKVDRILDEIEKTGKEVQVSSRRKTRRSKRTE